MGDGVDLEVDRVVDRIRQAGLSICHLQVKRPTLEDTFIRLVGPSADHPADGGVDEIEQQGPTPSDAPLPTESIA